MTQRWNNYQVTGPFKQQLEQVVESHKQQFERLPDQMHLKTEGVRPPIRFVTLEPYSTYIIRTRPTDFYSEHTAGSEYTVMVDGYKPVPVALTHWDGDGNDKQLISFVGDAVNAEITLMLDGNKTDPISLNEDVLTTEYLAEKIGAIHGIGAKNLNVTIWPGRWLIEFAGNLSGKTFNLLEAIRPEDAEFQVHVLKDDYADSRKTSEVYFHIPQYGKWDGDDETINDAVAAGTFGNAIWFIGQGYVVQALECRDYNGDGTPNL
jgi:hypothetical protein